jgi:hypothetical protein
MLRGNYCAAELATEGSPAMQNSPELKAATRQFGFRPQALIRSIRVAFPHHLEKRLEQDLEIEQQIPVVNVPEIEFDAPLDVLNRGCGAARAIALCPSRQAGLHVMPERIITHDFLKLIIVSKRVRPRTD